MTIPSRFRTATLLLLIFVLLAACNRRQEEVPTPVPTAVPPTAAVTPTLQPTATPQPRPTQPATSSEPQAQAVDPTAIDWAPQLLYASPAPGEEVLLDGAITLRFDQPMNQQSVEAALAVQQSASGRSVNGSFTWPRPDTVIFTPSSDFSRQSLYRVRLDNTAESNNGMVLDTAVDLELQTVGYLDISQTIPAADTDAVLPDAAITVIFNRPVVPLTSSGQQADLPQPLTLAPEVAGQGEWVSTSIYRFTPDEPLAGGATYEATVAAGFADFTGAVLENDVSWSFSTALPEVVGVFPDDGAEYVIPTDPITIEFNMAMDRSSTDTAVSLISTNRVAVPLDTEWRRDDTVLVITPTVRLELETTYQVRVTTAAQAKGGSGSLARESLTDFTTVPLPAILSTNPPNNALTERWQRGFQVNFASPMTIADFEDRITIDPAPANVNYYYGQPNSDYLNADFQLIPNQEYTVTIPGDAADPYGNTLGRDYTFTFTTASGGPLASFNLPQNIAQLTTSFESQVAIINRNVSRLDVTLFNLGLPLNLLGRPYDIYDYNPNADPTRTWAINPDTPREEVATSRVSLADGGALPTGIYLLTVNAPETEDDTRYWQNQRVLLTVVDTNIVVKEMFGAVHVWATDIGSGQPAAGLNLSLYNAQGVAIATAVSDSSGLATFPYDAGGYLEGVTVVSSEPGAAGFGVARSDWGNGIEPYQFDISASSGAEPALFAYIYTDRPIYRPGDTVYFKGIVRQPNFGRYNLPTKTSLTLSLNPDFYIESEPFNATIPVEIGPDGIFNGRYTLPAGVSLGSYRFNFEQNDIEAYRTFSVAEYRAPEFLVDLTTPASDILRGEAVTLNLDASYFFGGPAADLEVNWSVYGDTFRLDVPGPYFSFSDDGGFFYSDISPFFGGGSALGDFLLGGNGVTDSNGRFSITLPANLLAAADPGSRQITVEATVQALGNTPVTARTTLTFHAADVYVGVRATDYIQVAGEEAVVEVETVDWDGDSVGAQPVEIVFYQREWEAIRNADFGFYDTRWQPVDTEVARVALTTDAQGSASASFTPEFGGTYVAVATVTDGNGRTHTSSTTLWVTDASYVGWRTDAREKRMELIPDQNAYAPGDTARVLVQSPFAGPVQAWLTIERGDLLQQQLITLNSSSDVLDIPITADFAPNAFISIVAVKGVDPDAETNRPADIRLGIAELVVSPAQLTLDVVLTPEQDQYGPRDTAVYTIQTTDSSGSPVAADVSLALVDLAVLTLKEDNAPPITEAFYARQPYRSHIGGGLFISGEGLDVEIPLEVLGRGGGGGAEFASADAARLEQGEDDTVRRDFPDTAFWEARVQTDASGTATVEIPLPDSLTTWRLSAKAVTENTLVGQTNTDITVSLPLLLRPLTPRFFTVGDAMQLGTYVNNNTAAAIAAEVTIEADGVVVDGDLTQTVDVPANGRGLVLWPVTVQDVAAVDLTFRVTGGGFRDATKPTFGQGPDQLIPVHRYNAPDTSGTSGVLAEPGRQVEAVLLPPNADLDSGSVDITLNPSLAAALLDTLTVVNNDDLLNPNCAYAITDQLLPNVALATAASQLDTPALADLQPELDDVITVNIAQLESLLLDDGGWGWCYSSESNPWLTAYTLFALDKAQEAGYSVTRDLLLPPLNFIEGQLTDPAAMDNSYEANRQAFFLYVLAEQERQVTANLDRLFAEQRTRLDPYAKALLALAYHLNGDRGSNWQTLMGDLNESAVLTAAGAHWQDETRDFRNLNSDVRGTAVALYALAQMQPDSALLPPAVRWLMAARSVERWSTSHETAWATLALSGWMAASGELDADFAYDMNVNLQPVLTGSFGAANITESVSDSVALANLVPDEVNYFSIFHQAGPGSLYYTLYLNSAIPASEVTAVSRGVTVQRTYYDDACDPTTTDCQPIDTISAGDRVRVELTIIAANDLLYATVTDPIPAGAEAVDPGLATSSAALNDGISRVQQSYRYGYWGWWYFNRIEYRDDRVVFLSEFLPAGTYQYTYYLDTTLPGSYQVRPAVAQETFFPEVFGRSDGQLFVVTE